MRLIWTGRARRDLIRLHDFLRVKSVRAARKVFQTLGHAPEILVETPRLGQLVEGTKNREVRRLLVGDYEIRYEVIERDIYILGVFHTRENR